MVARSPRGQCAPISAEPKSALFHVIANGARLFPVILNNYQDPEKWHVLSGWLDRLRAQPTANGYVYLYEDENRILDQLAQVLTDASEDMSIMNKIDPRAPNRDLIRFLMRFGTPEGVDQKLIKSVLPCDMNSLQVELKAFGQFTVEEKREAAELGALFSTAVFVLFHQILSVTVHGAKMTVLVPKALAGDEDAFLKAIHIDRGLLTAHPKFAERYQSAIREGNTELRNKIAYRLTSPPTKGETKSPLMFAVLAMLDSIGWLDNLTHVEVLGVYIQAGGNNGDESTVAKALKRYRRYQNTGGVSMH